MMNRKELIQDFFKNMDSMARIGTMHRKHDHRPKHMPPHAQVGVLFVVSHRGPLSIKEISDIFGMTSSAATQLVNSLVKNKFLARAEDKVDRRKMLVTLTAQGKKIIASAKEYRLKKMTNMFESLTDTELSQLVRIQAKIVDHWETSCNKNTFKNK
jgi:DNA-binding MarR family transcriptional regulator